MDIKKANFNRIAEQRVNKIIELISKLNNLRNTSFYEYTDDQIENLFNMIQKELDKQKNTFLESSKKDRKKIEL